MDNRGTRTNLKRVERGSKPVGGSATLSNHRRRFSIARFASLVALQLTLLLLAFRAFLPRLWVRNVAAGGWAFALVFLGMHLFLSFFEWFFHRYVLHGV